MPGGVTGKAREGLPMSINAIYQQLSTGEGHAVLYRAQSCRPVTELGEPALHDAD